MCCSTGLPATGAIGFGITPVSGKSLVPFPAAKTIAFMSTYLPRGVLALFSAFWRVASGLPRCALLHLEFNQPCRARRIPDKELLGTIGCTTQPQALG